LWLQGVVGQETQEVLVVALGDIERAQELLVAVHPQNLLWPLWKEPLIPWPLVLVGQKGLRV
jgi:hypothetical protein